MEEHKIKINYWLTPFSLLYGIGVALRNKLFDWGILHSRQFNIPTICIGNLTVGGTGKTPHTEYLIKLLQEDLQVAVLSRGYRRESKGFVLASADSSVKEMGDEPFQMKQKFPAAHIAVDANRCEGIERLCKTATPSPKVILLDDAYQHRYVKAGLNILLTDYNRPVYEDALLPAGRLRESLFGKKRADIIIVTKCPPDIEEETYEEITRQLKPASWQQLFFSTFVYGELFPLGKENGHARTLDTLRDDDQILLITGIASPYQLLSNLKKYTSQVQLMEYPDHHAFTEEDISEISRKYQQMDRDKGVIITTEKDATRLIHHPNLTEELRKAIYILPIKVEFMQDKQEMFNKQIIDYVNKNTRNG